ncbi:hypothetical protein GUITHDRAFT_164194 [Guillardia theta CCMP2712]|uniref:Uncharacterized protein n=1 Tax=Guillardia theta (strain CCMP2712) TaxID=905079 RepID=L1J112_GUITC|nr:hypothetical protein GUITHDRAFT_164194 [Guillardia theta CCMP2712]EKX42218.1 hypothetical protein GUITHDRAFT_164194 [Guillardia theta CCMP2712]|eukprot:XP_005829198.1 hypothetical protein GUITHDRAFT_164194 [Guillardia theta CCMP2712]
MDISVINPTKQLSDYLLEEVSKGDIEGVKRGDVKMLSLLLESRPDLEVKSHLLKITPLHSAINTRSIACVRLLLDAGADFEAENDIGERPLHVAIQRGDVEIVKILLQYGADARAPAPVFWQSEVPRLPHELASMLEQPKRDLMLRALDSVE